MVELKGRNAIVTGAAVGLGNSYARALAAEGINVAVCDIRDDIADLGKELEATGVKVVCMKADVSVPADVRKFVDAAKDAFGSIDILVNNAGKCWASLPDDDLDKSIEDYDGMVGSNLKGEFLMGRAVMPLMIKQGTGGDIINIQTDHMVTCGTPFDVCPRLESCPWGEPPRPTGTANLDVYDASKWALNGLTFAWAKAMAPHGVRVNGICMGATDSHMIRGFFGYAPDQEEWDEEAKKEIDTWMSDKDAARVIVDLLKEGPEGRTAKTMNFCVGRPCKLEPAHPDVYVLEEHLHVAT